MKTPFFLFVCIAICTGFKAGAQFYAPETEFHDKAQRLFVVETARVLAWRENLDGQQISEITYRVSVNTNRVTEWLVNWLNSDGKPVKQVRINYPESLLAEGPGFYRKVFKQFASQTRRAVATNLTTAELSARFWEGAELTGMAREDGLRAAYDLIGEKPAKTEAESAPKLAGLLTHIPMPSLSGGITMDAMLLARGAAWLALSESMLRDPNSAADENWSPILFMAGRENTACALWTSKIKTNSAAEKSRALFVWWDFFLRRPTARAAFEFATTPEQRRYGMPMMTYYSRLEHLGSPLVEVLWLQYGRDPKAFAKLYNYGGFLSASTDVSGGRILEGAWPAIFREEWLKNLKSFPASALDYNGHVETLKVLSSSSPLLDSDEADASLVRLKEFTPLLKLGYEQGTGKLIPVATVTARDLLNYGWEMNALQMGARYYFVQHVWGVPELAETIFKRATRDLEGQLPFFSGEFQKKVFNFQESLYRLQMVDDLGWRVQADIQPYAKDITDASGARTFHRRCWLRPYEVRWQAYALARANLGDEMIVFLRRYHAECGPKSDVITVEYLLDWNNREIDAQPGLKELKEQIAESFLEPTGLQAKALYRKRFAALNNAARAQAYEQIFWKNPDSDLEQSILNGYIVGGAWKSAKRFYTQARDVVSRDVGFSNMLTPKIWLLAFLQGDEETMKLALEDSDTGSYTSMMTAVWHHAAHGETKEMERQLDQLIERYESGDGPSSQGRLMKSFIPLIPAFGDTKHPQHEEALDHFGKAEKAIILRWILIQKYKLTPEDAIRFLGGKETDRQRRVLIVYLQKDKESMRAAFADYIENTENTGVGRVLASWLEHELLNIPIGAEEMDLRDPSAKSIRQAVMEKLRE